MRFGELLRLSRQKSKRSINQVCTFMGWSVPQLMHYEHGRHKPPESYQLTKLADFLELDNKDEFINLGIYERGNLEIKFPSLNETYIDLAKALARSKGLTAKQAKNIQKILESEDI